MKKYILTVCLGILLTGCATQNVGKNMSPDDRLELNAPLYCEGEMQCKDVWERAMYYVTSNSGYKIQNANDMLIQTYNPTQIDTKLAWQITKKPLGNGKYQILTSAWCNNVSGCYPDAYEATLAAKRYMKIALPEVKYKSL